jgi:hypothetical protein
LGKRRTKGFGVGETRVLCDADSWAPRSQRLALHES